MKLHTALKLLPGDVINGFSYSFTKTLTDFLREKLDSHELFSEKIQQEAEENPQRNLDAFPEVATAMHYLADQLNSVSHLTSLSNIRANIEGAEAFLAIFERPMEVTEEEIATIIMENIADGTAPVKIIALFKARYGF